MLSLTRNHLRRLAAGSTHAAASIKKDVFPKSYSENAVNISETQTDVFPSESLYAVDEFSTGFKGVGAKAFSETVREALSVSINEDDIEVKPDGLLYLPEIKYRRILNKSFGQGGWGIIPRGPHSIIGKTLTREYALIAEGRFVSLARGEQDFWSPEGLPTASEGCKSNALMRCCKDLGISSELWDPTFIRNWKARNAVEVWAIHTTTKAKKRLWRRKDDPPMTYPFQEI